MNDKNKLPLDEWQKLCDDATAGPWESDADGDVFSTTVNTDDPEYIEAAGFVPPKDICTSSAWRGEDDPDPKFIAMARTAVPALIARVEDLELELQAERWSHDLSKGILETIVRLILGRLDTTRARELSLEILRGKESKDKK